MIRPNHLPGLSSCTPLLGQVFLECQLCQDMADYRPLCDTKFDTFRQCASGPQSKKLSLYFGFGPLLPIFNRFQMYVKEANLRCDTQKIDREISVDLLVSAYSTEIFMGAMWRLDDAETSTFAL